ncbi:MAG: hypothetical protein GY801_10270 [bacterium]|nr:hypothetical protein [bacterium]
MDTILTVKNRHLQDLNSVEAVELFRELLYAEAMRIGVPLKNSNTSTRADVPDGGIDASIHADIVSSQERFLFKETGSRHLPEAETALKTLQELHRNT